MNQVLYPKTFEMYQADIHSARRDQSAMESRSGQQFRMIAPDQWQRQAYIANSMGIDLAQVLYPQTAQYSQFIAPGYAGFRIFDTARQTYRNSGDVKETVLETGDATLFHLFATIGIPLLVSSLARKYIKLGLEHIRAPKWPARHAGAMSILLSGGLLLLLTKPVNNFVGHLLDRYYRPWVKLKQLNEIRAHNAERRRMTVS